MKINIEVQTLISSRDSLRGIPFYVLNLLISLTRRKNNDYSISFFDYGKERGNRKYIDEYIDAETLRNLTVCECNTLSYGTIMKAQQTNDSSLYDAISYNEYTGTNPDVFHFPHPAVIPANIIGQTVVTAHDIIPLIDKYKAYLDARTAHLFPLGINVLEKYTDITLISDSQNTKNDLIEHTSISPERIFVVPLAYDKSVHYPQKNPKLLTSFGLASDVPYLLYLAAIDPRKGVFNIIDAFSIIRESFGDLKLVLAGGNPAGGFYSEVRERTVRSPYANDIIMPGFVSDEQKRALLSGAEIFLFPSEYEGFGLPVLEAMACGVPVITTNVSSLPEVCGDAAVYVEPNATEQLAYEIERLLDSEALRREYTQKGFAQAAKFSWDETARMTEEVYKIAYERR